MSLRGIEFKRPVDVLLVAMIGFVGAAIAMLCGLLFVYGPLWPVGMLYYLRANNDTLAHDGVGNPQAQRVFSAVALGCLLALAVCFTFGQNTPRWHVAEAMAGGLFLWLTYVVFEWHMWAAVKELSLRLIGLVLGLVSTSTDQEELNGDAPTELPTADDKKAKTAAIAGIIAAFAFAFAGIWIVVDKTSCWLFNWCH